MSLDHIRQHAQIQISAWQQQEIEALAAQQFQDAAIARRCASVLEAFIRSLEDQIREGIQ